MLHAGEPCVKKREKNKRRQEKVRKGELPLGNKRKIDHGQLRKGGWTTSGKKVFLTGGLHLAWGKRKDRGALHPD